ncbi:MAG TPA: DNA-binding protein [Sneathiellales bacterium]|nr:DNA-binding protein [Sneathiellales bacterium]
MKTNNNHYLNKAEIAEYLRIKPRTVDAWMERKILPFLKIGGKSVRFRKSDVDHHLEKFKIDAQ